MNLRILINTTILPFMFVLAGCMQPPEVNKEFGPEFTTDQLNKALGAAQDEATKDTVMNIKKGEFAYFEKTNQIENLFPIVTKQRADTVTDRVEDANKVTFTITRQLVELDSASGNMKPSQSQSSACLEKVDGGCNTTSSVAEPAFSVPDVTQTGKFFKALAQTPPPDFGAYTSHMNDLSWRAIVKQAASGNASGTKWTVHNLKVIRSSTPTPTLVAMRPDCGGRKAPCSTPMATTQVTFDEVDWSSEKYPVKYSYNLVFSAEAPFFASQLLSCGSTTIPYQGQRISVLQCDTTKDFTVGNGP